MIHKIEFKGNVYCCNDEKYFAACLYIGDLFIGIQAPIETLKIAGAPMYVQQVMSVLRGKVCLPSRSKNDIL